MRLFQYRMVAELYNRSLTKILINLKLILEKLGGGGHITLAGAQLEGFTLEEAHDELVIRINEYLVETQ